MSRRHYKDDEYSSQLKNLDRKRGDEKRNDTQKDYKNKVYVQENDYPRRRTHRNGDREDSARHRQKRKERSKSRSRSKDRRRENHGLKSDLEKKHKYSDRKHSGEDRGRDEKRKKLEDDEEEEGEVDELLFSVEDPEEEEKRLELERQKRWERLTALESQLPERDTFTVSMVEVTTAPDITEDDEEESDAPLDIVKNVESTFCEVEVDASGGGDTVYSTTLRAVAGKEDRPTFDMFSASPSLLGEVKKGVSTGPSIARTAHVSILADESDDPTLQANWTDQDGYYRTRIGEIIEGRYKVLGTIGQGVFSTVLKCLDMDASGKEVALKMIRANDTMRKAAVREVSICRELAAHDPLSRKHCILMLASLEHKNHVAMVFESMQMNLRETLKKFGRRIGINVQAVRAYARQLFVALRHLASRRIIHADIKPDNILVNQGFGCLKVADFGSAFHETDPDVEPTPYLVSRWYRAPEIILGLEYDRAIDTWSVAATLYELYMGTSLFPGRDNNEMLAKMMDLKGPFPSRMIKQHLRQFDKIAGLRPHFNEDLQFILQEPDPITGKAKVRFTNPTAPVKSLRQLLLGGHHSSGEDRETVIHLADFLDKCLNLDPRRRLLVTEAFEHPFLKVR